MTHENYMKFKCVSLNNVLSEHCHAHSLTTVGGIVL